MEMKREREDWPQSPSKSTDPEAKLREKEKAAKKPGMRVA